MIPIYGAIYLWETVLPRRQLCHGPARIHGWPLWRAHARVELGGPCWLAVCPVDASLVDDIRRAFDLEPAHLPVIVTPDAKVLDIPRRPSAPPPERTIRWVETGLSLGNRARSTSKTRCPWRASNIAVGAPAQRPPTTIASYTLATSMPAIIRRAAGRPQSLIARSRRIRARRGRRLSRHYHRNGVNGRGHCNGNGTLRPGRARG